ncbi:hypothetical protein ACH3VR_06225 [Microbacterium sp. B2969]|uniref:PASTA domain-containing protein n=1 Tax=Microbacterium alkaliflavum TaxID=3248839 RepID=A0ABW7Q5D8_9MICO
MSVLRRAVAVPVVASFAVIVLAACATGSGGSAVPFGAAEPALPSGEVVGQGTVLEADGEAQLCLGPVADSYPPQCSGIPLDGWSWDGVDGSESSNGVTWGAYVVQGTYDGSTLTVTAPPILLALYDPMPMPDPTGGEPGSGDEATLADAQDSLADRLGTDYVSSSIDNGYLWVDVVWDDGSYQDAADREFGEKVVVVRSALREAA